MKYYVIAGEASGDLHASNLIKGIKKYDPQADVRGWGGDLMREAGADVIKHYKDTAVMGIVTVIRKMGTIKANIKNCCADMEQWHADVVILVDYGGFNLQIARFAKTHNFKTFYYIAPKIWAWNTSRVRLIKKYVDKTYVIFPFEKDFYRKYNCEVDYEGNPLTDAIYNYPYKGEDIAVFRQDNHLSEKPIIALLAGSRRQELKNILPRMLWMVEEFPDYQFVIAGAPSMTDSDYAPYMKAQKTDKRDTTRVRIIYGQTYRLLQHARAALVASGTATLEAALLHTPQVVCYTTDGERIYYLIFKYLMKINCVSLVNLIMDGQEVVKELLMQKFTKKNLLTELTAILCDEQRRARMLSAYKELEERLGQPGASDRFAENMVKAIHS